jgi:anti-sigma factor RsiW
VSRQAPCAAWLEAISAYLDGALISTEEQRVHAHMRQCPGCAEFLVDLVPVVQALHALPKPVPRTDPWPEISRQLRRDPAFYRRRFLLRVEPRVAGWAAAGFLFLATGSMAAISYQQSASAPTADVDMYWQQHEFYSQEQGVPSLYAPELNAVEASYQIEP